MSEHCLWIPCHSKGKALLLSRTWEKLHRQYHDLFPAAENPEDTGVVTQWQVGKPILRLYCNMVKKARLECHCIFVPLSACACEEIELPCLCIISCGVLSLHSFSIFVLYKCRTMPCSFHEGPFVLILAKKIFSRVQ